MARGCDSVAYVTVGTGIGVGILSGGRMVHGLGHPEVGHLKLRRHPLHAGFDGSCPYHGDCLEGLASGPAIQAAFGAPLDQIDPDHQAWRIEAHYLGQLCATLILTVAPQHIVLGGGVMNQRRLLDGVRAVSLEVLGDYAGAWDARAAATRITCTGCNEPPGLIGAYLIA